LAPGVRVFIACVPVLLRIPRHDSRQPRGATQHSAPLSGPHRCNRRDQAAAATTAGLQHFL